MQEGKDWISSPGFRDLWYNRSKKQRNEFVVQDCTEFGPRSSFFFFYEKVTVLTEVSLSLSNSTKVSWRGAKPWLWCFFTHLRSFNYLPTSLQCANAGLQCIINSEAVTGANHVEREGFLFSFRRCPHCWGLCQSSGRQTLLMLPPHLLIAAVINTVCRWE